MSTGNCNNLSLNLTLARNSTDNPIFPRRGSEFSASVQLTPPYSLFSNKDYSVYGKDDYVVDGYRVPYHLIDIAEPGYKYNVFEFQRDFLKAYDDICSRNILPILCGGTGMYLESVLKGYKLLPVPENPELRVRLADKSLEELTAILSSYKKLHNSTDVDTAKRAIRAIEIEEYYLHQPVEARKFPEIHSLIIGVDIDRELRREKILQKVEAASG